MHDHYQRWSRLPSLILSDYSTRILIGLLGSLGVLLVLFHFPLRTKTESQVGWSMSPPERMLISEIQRPEGSGGKGSGNAESKEHEDAPVPTRHEPTAQNSPTGSSNGGGTESGEGAVKNETEPDRKQVVPVTQLSVDTSEPNLIGGRAALYLQINYPYQARMEGIEGRLKLRFTVTSKGGVRRINVEESLHPLCDSAAVRALRSVRFQPAKRRGDPIPVRMSLPIRFELEKPDTTSFRATHWGPGG